MVQQGFESCLLVHFVRGGVGGILHHDMLIHGLHVPIKTHKALPLAGKQGGDFVDKSGDVGEKSHFSAIVMDTIEQFMLDHGDALLKTIEEEPMGIEALLPPAEEHGRALVKDCIPAFEGAATSTRTICFIDSGDVQTTFCQ